MTPEISELVQRLGQRVSDIDDYTDRTMKDAAAALHRLSERCEEAERERDEFAKVLASPLADEVIKQADRAESAEGRLAEAVNVLEMCQECIRDETPEDMTHEEAKEYVISKIRAVILADVSSPVSPK